MAESYESLADTIRSRIESGEYADGERIPSVTYWEKQGFMRGTITRAIAALRAEGLVVSQHGKGTVVRQRFPRIPRRSPGRLAREHWAAGTAIQDHDTGTRPREVDVVVGDVEPPADVAVALGVNPGVKVLSRSRRFTVDQRVVQLATSYLPTELTRGTQIEHTNTGPGGTYARLDEQGSGPTRFTERVIARGPRPEEIGALGLRKSGGMVFEVRRQAFAGERCVEVTVMVLDAEVYELIYDILA